MANKDNTVEGVVSQVEKLLERIARAVNAVCENGEDAQDTVEREFLRSAFGETTGRFHRLNERLLWLSDKQTPSDRRVVRSRAAGFRKTFKAHRVRFLTSFPDEKDRGARQSAPAEGATNCLGPHAVNQIKQAVRGGGRPLDKPAFTQKAVAALCCIKSGAATVANWETGRTKKVPCGYKKDLREKGGEAFFNFVSEYLRTHRFNKELKLFLEGKVVYTEGLSEREAGQVQDYINKRRQGLV